MLSKKSLESFRKLIAMRPRRRPVNAVRSAAAIRDDWPVFIESIQKRLKVGERDYGDSSFEVPLVELVDEIQQELEDVAGWSFIMWSRLRQLSEAAKKIK